LLATDAVGKPPVTPSSSKAQKQKIRYTDMLERARKSIQCLPFGNDIMSYNCVMYQVSPQCFHKILTTSKVGVEGKVSGRGIELGEENQSFTDSFYTCVLRSGVLGT